MWNTYGDYVLYVRDLRANLVNRVETCTRGGDTATCGGLEHDFTAYMLGELAATYARYTFRAIWVADVSVYLDKLNTTKTHL